MHIQDETACLHRLLALVDPGEPFATDPKTLQPEGLKTRISLCIPGRGWFLLKQSPEPQTGQPCDRSVYENTLMSTGTSKITMCGGIHFKFNPKKPGIEYAIHHLDTLLFKQAVSNPSLFIQIHPPETGVTPVLATQTVYGQTVLDYLQKNDYPDPSTWPCSRASFTQQLILQCLIGPGDGKLDNFMLGDQTLWAIDNEMAFEPECVQRLGSHGHVTHLHCFLWLLPQMAQRLEPSVLNQLTLDTLPNTIATWLYDLDSRNQQYQALNLSHLTLTFPPGFIESLLTRLTALQRVLRTQSIDSITGLQLFEAVLPAAAAFYQGVRQSYGHRPLTEQVKLLQQTKLPGEKAISFESMAIPIPTGVTVVSEETLETQKHFLRMNDSRAIPGVSPQAALNSLDQWVETQALSSSLRETYLQTRMKPQSQLTELTLQGDVYQDETVLTKVKTCIRLNRLTLIETGVTVDGVSKLMSLPACVNTTLVWGLHPNATLERLKALANTPLISHLMVLLQTEQGRFELPIKPVGTIEPEGLKHLHALLSQRTVAHRPYWTAVESWLLSVGYAQAALQALSPEARSTAWGAAAVRYQVRALAESSALPEAYCQVYRILDPTQRTLFYRYLQQIKDKNLVETLLAQLDLIPDPDGRTPQYLKQQQTWSDALRALVEPAKHPLPSAETPVVLRGLDIEPGYLHPDSVQALKQAEWLTPEGELNWSQKYRTADSSLRQGNHMVFTLNTNTHRFHVKCRPDFPGMELAYSLLSERIVGPTSPRVALWLWQTRSGTEPVLISETIPGMTLTPDLLKTTPVDLLSYQALVLMALITRPGDGNPGNFMAQSFQLPDGASRLRLISIDNDRLFAPPFEGGKLRAASILYCMDLIKTPLLPALRQRFLSLDVYAVLQAWLNDLVETNRANLSLVDEKSLDRYLQPGHDQPSYLLSLLKRETLTQLFKTMKTLQYWLTRSPELPLIDLLGHLNPSLANHYQQVLAQTDADPLARFEAAVQNEYRKDLIQGIKHYTSTLHMTQYLALHDRMPTPQKTVISHWQEDVRHAQAELKALSISTEALLFAKHELIQGRFKAFAELPEAAAQSEVLASLVWDDDFIQLDGKPDIARQQVVFDVLVREPGLKPLDSWVVQQAQGLTPGHVTAMLKRCPQLRVIKWLHCPQIGPVFEILPKLNLDSLEHLTVQHCASLYQVKLAGAGLKYLDLKQNPNLVKLNLNTPLLKQLNLAHTPIQTWRVQAPRLIEIDCSGNPYLGDAQLKILVQDCPELQQINLSGCDPKQISYGAVKSRIPNFAALSLEPEEMASYAGLLGDLLANAIKKVNLEKQAHLSGLAMACLGRALMDNASVTELALEYCQLTERDAQVLADVLVHHPALTELNLEGNKLGTQGGVWLGHALVRNQTLTGLDLNLNSLGDKAGVALAEALVRNQTLTELFLGFNSLGDKAGMALAEALVRNQALTRLFLVFNSLGDKAGVALAEALVSNQTLTSLDLSGNSLGDKAAVGFAKTLVCNQTLTNLDLSFNKIADIGTASLARALEHNTRLTHLYLACNSISPQGLLCLKGLKGVDYDGGEFSFLKKLASGMMSAASSPVGLAVAMKVYEWTLVKVLSHQGQTPDKALAIHPYTFFAEHTDVRQQPWFGLFQSYNQGRGERPLEAFLKQWDNLGGPPGLIRSTPPNTLTTEIPNTRLTTATQPFGLIPIRVQQGQRVQPDSIFAVLAEHLKTFSRSELRVLLMQHWQAHLDIYLSFAQKPDWDHWFGQLKTQPEFRAVQVLRGLAQSLHLTVVVFKPDQEPWVFKPAQTVGIVYLYTEDGNQYLRLKTNLHITPQRALADLIDASPTLPRLQPSQHDWFSWDSSTTSKRI